MTITLLPEQEAWIRSRVASGEFVSVEAAARQLIDDRIVEIDGDELAWAKPLVEEAIAAVERGEYVTLDQHRAHMAALLESLES